MSSRHRRSERAKNWDCSNEQCRDAVDDLQDELELQRQAEQILRDFVEGKQSVEVLRERARAFLYPVG